MNSAWIEVPLGVLPTSLSTVAVHGVLWQSNEDEFLLHVPGQARFWVQRQQPIFFVREPLASEPMIQLLRQGLPLAAYFVHRRCMTLHAAALSTPKGAVVIAGHSASGKSTLAAALAMRGYPLLADEIAPLAITSTGRLEVQPAVTDLFLWRDAIDQLSFGIERCTVVRPGLQRYALPPQPAATEPQPLAAIYLLAISNNPLVELTEVAGHNRFLTLQQFAYNRLLPAAPATRQQHFVELTKLLAKVPVRRIYRPRDRWSVHEIIAAIEQDLSL